MTNLPIEQLIRIELELRQRKARKAFLDTYLNDTAAFGYDLFDWDQIHPGAKPNHYQLDVWSMTDEFNRVAAMGPRGLGKTTLAAVFILKNAVTSEVMGQDWKAISTAGVWAQLENYAWPEIHYFRKLLRWDKIPMTPFNANKIMKLRIEGNHGYATAANSDRPDLIEGAHARRLYYVFDESKAISPGTFDAIEGALNNHGNEKGMIAVSLAISTPGAPQGRFWQIMTNAHGYERWKVRPVTLEDTIKAGMITQETADEAARQWGADSAKYRTDILGQFPESSEFGVIPRAWVMDAVERGELLKQAIANGDVPAMKVTSIGADPADEGLDLSIFARKYGNVLWGEFVSVPKVKRQNVSEMAKFLIAEIERHKNLHLAVDTNGVGSGVFSIVSDWLGKENRSALYDVQLDAFVASAKATDDWEEPRTDASGLYQFADRRSAAWWGLREKLNPRNNPTLCLPNDPKMIEELITPLWKELAGGRIKVESKDELRKPTRLGRSTDRADCIVQGEDKDYLQSNRIGFFVM